jgi:hypothetical protein
MQLKTLRAVKGVVFASVASFFILATKPKTLRFLKGVLYVTVASFFAMSLIAVYHVDKLVRHNGPAVSATLTNTNNTAVALKDTVVALTGTLNGVTVLTGKASHSLDIVNDPHKGSLMMFNQDLGVARSLMIHADLATRTVQQASTNEIRYLDQWNVQLTDTFKGINATVKSVDATVKTTDAAVKTNSQASDAALVQLKTFLVAGTLTERATTKLISDPNLPKITGNLAVGTKAGAAGAVDIQQYVHNALHPTWPHRIYSFISGLGVDAAKVFLP